MAMAMAGRAGRGREEPMAAMAWCKDIMSFPEEGPKAAVFCATFLLVFFGFSVGKQWRTIGGCGKTGDEVGLSVDPGEIVKHID